MKDINATILIELKNKSEEEIWRNIKYTRRKYIQQSQKQELYYEKVVLNEKNLKKMYNMHMQTLKEGGTSIWTYEKWRNFVAPAKDKFFYVKKEDKIVGCFILSEISKKLFGEENDELGIRPLVFANKKKYSNLRPNDYIYWATIKYSLENKYNFLDLGGWQINARGHLQNINQFKKQWGGKIIYYYLNYPFLTAIRRKLIRNFRIFWWLNSIIKKKIGVVKKSAHDDQIKNAAARNLTSSSSM